MTKLMLSKCSRRRKCDGVPNQLYRRGVNNDLRAQRSVLALGVNARASIEGSLPYRVPPGLVDAVGSACCCWRRCCCCLRCA
jgi:hypothetical protein